jgi:hypothetical protein
LTRAVLLFLLSLTLSAQTPAAKVSYACVGEDLDTAGLTCTTEHPCAIYLELASVETLAGKIFLTGNLHTSDVTLSSILLASDDGGRTWIEPHARLAGMGLEQIQFIDFENGWIGGQSLQGRPHDPFLLVTHDGGKIWQQRPLFEETRNGILQQFWFDSKNTGALIFDRMQPNENGSRYELYESQTGGDSWSPKEFSARPITIKRSRAGESNPDWRLRADAPTKTYHLEHRVAEKWQTVSVFPIHVTDCRKMETKLEDDAPPPEEEPKPAEPAKPVAPRKKKK